MTADLDLWLRGLYRKPRRIYILDEMADFTEEQKAFLLGPRRVLFAGSPVPRGYQWIRDRFLGRRQ